MSGSALSTYDNTVTLIMAAGALGLGYGAWNIGIISGNMTLMAGASYFTPVLSALFAALLLSTSLIFHLLARCCNGDNRSSLAAFWMGVVIVGLMTGSYLVSQGDLAMVINPDPAKAGIMAAVFRSVWLPSASSAWVRLRSRSTAMAR